MAQMTVEEASRILSQWFTEKSAEVQAQKAAMDYYGSYFKPGTLYESGHFNQACHNNREMGFRPVP